jgi:hypothetical protein
MKSCLNSNHFAGELERFPHCTNSLLKKNQFVGYPIRKVRKTLVKGDNKEIELILEVVQGHFFHHTLLRSSFFYSVISRGQHITGHFKDYLNRFRTTEIIMLI